MSKSQSDPSALLTSLKAASSRHGTACLVSVALAKSPVADKRSWGALRGYDAEKQEWGWARAAPVSQKSGGDPSSSPKKARRKVAPAPACCAVHTHLRTGHVCGSACCTSVFQKRCRASAQLGGAVGLHEVARSD